MRRLSTVDTMNGLKHSIISPAFDLQQEHLQQEHPHYIHLALGSNIVSSPNYLFLSRDNISATYTTSS